MNTTGIIPVERLNFTERNLLIVTDETSNTADDFADWHTILNVVNKKVVSNLNIYYPNLFFTYP